MSLANALAVAPAAGETWCCSVIRGSSSSRRRRLIRTASASRRSSTSSAARRQCRRTVDSSCRRRGACTRRSARLRPKLFYEGKLHGEDGLDRQRLDGTLRLRWRGSRGSCRCSTTGNQNVLARKKWRSSPASSSSLLVPGAVWVGRGWRCSPDSRAADLRIVAPFNAQVNRLVGTRSASSRRAGRHR